MFEGKWWAERKGGKEGVTEEGMKKGKEKGKEKGRYNGQDAGKRGGRADPFPHLSSFQNMYADVLKRGIKCVRQNPAANTRGTFMLVSGFVDCVVIAVCWGT